MTRNFIYISLLQSCVKESLLILESSTLYEFGPFHSPLGHIREGKLRTKTYNVDLDQTEQSCQGMLCLQTLTFTCSRLKAKVVFLFIYFL